MANLNYNSVQISVRLMEILNLESFNLQFYMKECDLKCTNRINRHCESLKELILESQAQLEVASDLESLDKAMNSVLELKPEILAIHELLSKNSCTCGNCVPKGVPYKAWFTLMTLTHCFNTLSYSIDIIKNQHKTETGEKSKPHVEDSFSSFFRQLGQRYPGEEPNEE